MQNEKLTPIIEALKNVLFYSDLLKSKINSVNPKDVNELKQIEKLKEYSNTLLADAFIIAEIVAEEIEDEQ